MIVMKFGGTSTQDAAAMANVAAIVKARLSLKPIVVVSAIADATNQLERAGRLAAEAKESEARDILLLLLNRHSAIVDALMKDRQKLLELRKTFTSALSELESLIKGVAILRELTPRTLDHVCSFGERLSSLIVSYVLRESSIDAEWVDTKDFMFTDDSYNRAVPLMETVEQRLRRLAIPLLEQGKVIVTQGFIGVTERGDRTTMGRESSDYSAALIGAVLDARDVQIWTDVDGVLTADPTVVRNPKKVKVLSFEEAFELSFFGAKVLHPNTMLPALEKNIPIHVYNSRRPELSGTLIASSLLNSHSVVKSITYKKKISVVSVTPRKRLSPFIFWEHIYSVLTKYGVAPQMAVTSEYNIAIAVDSQNHLSSIVHDLGEIGLVELIDGKGIVGVVGSNIRGKEGVVNAVFSAIADSSVTMISHGASASSLSFVVNEEQIPAIVQRLHTALFEASADRETFEVLELREA